MVQTPPIIQDGILTYQQGDSTAQVMVDSSEWYDWLQTASTFTFRSGEGHFTARKEGAGNRRGRLYWRAYHTRHGKLHRVYLGKSEELTFERLRAIAAVLADQAPPQDPSQATVHEAEAAPLQILGTPEVGQHRSLPTLRILHPHPHEPGHLPSSRGALPTGTITLLFTDIEGSTQLLQQLGERYTHVLTAYGHVLRSVFAQYNGFEVDTQEDAFFMVFARATDAISAAVAAQRALASHGWPEDVKVGVRMGVHTGEPERAAEEGYVGLDVHHAAHIMSSGYGGQVLLSQATRDLVEHDLPEDVSLRDLGAHHLKDLQHPSHLFQLVIAGLPADFPPFKTLDVHPNNLPVQPTPFIGREQEVAAVAALLSREHVRLLTLTGTGGTGKTRLGLQVAAELSDRFADGVFFVNLAPIRDPEFVLPAIAQTFNIKEARERSLLDLLQVSLRAKHMLLLLDNFEQVVRAAEQVAALLAACPKLKIMVTSRMGLHVRAEQEFAVPPLSLPDPTRLPDLVALAQYEAVALFVARAQALKADFALTEVNARAVAEICVRLDGLPLAIELAVARIKLLPPQALLRRLSHRLEVLTGGAQDLPARQQTLRNTLQWNYDLLTEQEQRLFRRLAVFVGGCTLEAAQAVCCSLDNSETNLIEAVTSLMDKSFVQQREEGNDEPRLLMLETVHEYAWERLSAHEEVEAMRQAHAAYYLRFAEEAEHGLLSTEQEQWLKRLERENENLRAALSWLIEQGELETTLRFAAALWRFWSLHGHHREGYSILEQLLSSAGASAVGLRAKALIGAGVLTGELGRHVQAEELCKEGLQLFRELQDRQGIILSLWALGKIVHKKSQYATARTWAEEALALSREMGDAWGIATSLETLTMLAGEEGRYEEARSLAEELLQRSKQVGNSRGVTAALMALGLANFMVGDMVRGQEFLTECLVQTHATGNVLLIAYTLFLLGYMACFQGEYVIASALLEEGMMYAQKVGDREAHWWWHLGRALVAFGQSDYPVARTELVESLNLLSQWEYSYPFFAAWSLDMLGEVTAALGEPAWAARLWGTAQGIRRRDDIPARPPVFRSSYEQYITMVREKLGEEAFQAALAEGQAMTPEQALAARGSVTLPRAPGSRPTAVPFDKTPRYPAGLTAREVEILRLVAQGMTDAQVAEQLVISRRTVNWHLTSIYSKLGVTSRNAATRYVIEHHLV